MKHAKRSGWRPFWAALCAALLVLLPLVGGTVLLSRAQLRSSLRQAAKSQSGVPIRLPKAADRCTVLLCVADETPGFVLAYLNAGQNCIHLLAVPAALEVPFGGKNVPLADCYAAAGPARCREALGEVFALPEDTDYLAIAPAVLTKLAARYGAVRVGFTGPNRFFALLLALAMLLSMSALAESVTLTDMTGHEITIDEPVTRIDRKSVV